MIEKVATAIGAPFDHEVARRAIAALRDPTPSMILAGRRQPEISDDTGMHLGTGDCDVNALTLDPQHPSNTTRLRYQAMIDAALGA